MSWFEGTINTRLLHKKLVELISTSGNGWSVIPSYHSGDNYASYTTYDGLMVTKNINGDDIFLGFHPVTPSASAFCMVINLYRGFVADTNLSKEGSYKNKEPRFIYFGRMADNGSLINTEGYSVKYKLSVTEDKILIALKSGAPNDNFWSILSIGTLRKHDNVTPSDSALAVFSTWSYASGNIYKLLLYYKGMNTPQYQFAQGYYDFAGNGKVGSTELITPIFAKDYNGGYAGSLGFFYSYSNNAFREGDEVEINGKTFIALHVYAYGAGIHGSYFADSLNYSHAKHLDVLIPKE